MRYALLVYSDPSVRSPLDEGAAARAEPTSVWNAVLDALSQVGAARDGRELAAEAKVIRVRDGAHRVIEGPYAETEEQLGGLFVTELADLDEAIRIAGLISQVTHGATEIRPLVEH